MYTKLSVFDFDNTLILTPEDTSENRQEWADYYGEEWPYMGWWGRKESLDMDVWDMPVKPEVIKDYQIEKSNSDTMVIMMTGRIERLRTEVESILEKYGLEFDLKILKDRGKTEEYKLRMINKILKDVPTIDEVEIWDDRDEHIPIFERWGRWVEHEDGIKVTVNHVI